MNMAKSLAIVAALLIGSIPATTSAAAATSAQVKEAQTIMKKFGIPAGPIDGQSGPQTSRGLCAFRYIAGLPVTRGSLDSTTLARLRSYNKAYTSLGSITARSVGGSRTYVVVHETCQAMVYAQSSKYKRVMATSTGMKGHETRNGTYALGYTNLGWSCSTIYPESCSEHPGVGAYADKYGTFGNMYNKRHVYGGVFVHGSTSVPTYPASHGCIRVTPADSDWMFKNVGNNGKPPIIVTGAY